MVGQRVNNFEIRRLLAEGGMGAVYEAEHPTLGKKIAVKVLRPELVVDAATVQRFFNEARAASSIHHPNIIEVTGLGLLPDGVPYMMMELLEGECLSHRLAREGPLTIERALDIAIQVSRGLQAAHLADIVHRDLKPDNVFLVGDRQVKLLDFGIAKLLGDLSAISVATVAGTVFGTPPYMSPEQCRGSAVEIDHRSDIYALGIILYEVLCGKPPFSGAGLGEVMMMHLTTEPVRPTRHRPEIPAALERIILRALAKDPRERFATMAEMTVALTALAAPGSDPPARSRARPRWLHAAAAGGMLLAVVVAAHLARGRLAAPGREEPTLSRPQVTAIAPLPPPPAPALLVEASAAPRGRLSGRESIRRPAARRRAPALSVAGDEPKAAEEPTPEVAFEARPPLEPGYLSLDSAPWANVSLGGRLLGSTPLIRTVLPPGRHTLTLSNPEIGTTTTYVVDIKPGAAVSRFVGWEKQ